MILCGLLIAGEVIPSADSTPLELKVKGAYLFNFAKFVEWPASAFREPKSPFVFAVLGDDAFSQFLGDSLKDKTVSGRPIMVRRFTTVDSIEPSHILYVNPSFEAKEPAIFKRLGKESVASVGETPRFARTGGVFRFLLMEGKVRFEVNPDAAHRAGLSISAKLLQVGIIVKDEEGAR